MANYKDFFRDKKITVMGLGLLGRGVGDVEFLASFAEEIIVTDLKSESQLKESLERLGRFNNIKYRLGGHDKRDFKGRDFILKAAGVPKDSFYLKYARKHKVPVYMSTALFAKFTPATVIGITGTRGKTTVTYMVYETLSKLFQGGRRKVFLGGNIRGVATLPMLPKTKTTDVAVLELDSWQLQGFGDLKISPQISAFTTFYPDHMDYYKKSMKEYAKDKANIFNNQKRGDTFVVSSQTQKEVSKYIKLPRRTTVADLSDTKDLKLRLPGEHNLLNASVAYEILRAVGVSANTIKKQLSEFKGVSGRLEYISKINGISIYNDTTATTPEAAMSAIKALGDGRNLSLILGGYDKNLKLAGLRELIRNHCVWISLVPGSGTQRLIKEGIIPYSVPRKLYKSFPGAINAAFRHAPAGGIVLLSSGFASFGMFKNEYDRGDQFVGAVRSFKEALKKKKEAKGLRKK